MPLKPSKAELKTKCDKSCCRDDQTSSVFLLNNDIGTDELEMVKLKHPGSGQPAYFVFTKENKKVFELMTFNECYRSYFIEDKVKSDGKLYMTTPMDPLFLALPYLISSKHCSPLDQILRDDDFPNIERLCECSGIENRINKIADKKGVSIFGYKYNEEKTLSWLEGKVERTVAALRQQSIQVSSATSVVSNNFLKYSSENKETTENYLKYGFGVVSEYLGGELKQKLQERLKIPNETESSATKRNRSATREQDQHSKKSKISTDMTENSENSPPSTKRQTPKAKTPSQSVKDKAKAKAAVGSKSIASFFKKGTA